MSRQAFIFIILIVALLSGAFIGFKLLNPAKPDSANNYSPSIPVKTAFAKQENMPVYIRSIGTVVSPHQVDIRPQVEGILTELLVQGGQTVKQGDLLARIEDQTIKAALQQQRAELGNIKAQLDVAKLDLNRYQQLGTHNAVSKQSLEQQKALVNQLEQTMLARQAMIKEQEIKLSYTTIHAPINGAVGVINIHPGNHVQAGSSIIFSIVQISPIQVEVAVTQNTLAQLLPMLKQQSLQQIPMIIYDKTGSSPLAQGKLVLLDNQVSAQTGTVRIRAQFDNESMILWPGQTVSTLIQIQTIKDATVIPQTAIRQGQESPYVWRIQNDKATLVPIEVLHSDQNFSAVKGIQANDEIVVDGASRLLEGLKIQRIEQEERPPTQSPTLDPQAFYPGSPLQNTVAITALSGVC